MHSRGYEHKSQVSDLPYHRHHQRQSGRRLYNYPERERSASSLYINFFLFIFFPSCIQTSSVSPLLSLDLGIPHPPQVDLQPSTSFTYAIGRNRLLSTRIRAMSIARGGIDRQYGLPGGGDTSKKDVYLYLSGFVDMGSHSTVGFALF